MLLLMEEHALQMAAPVSLVMLQAIGTIFDESVQNVRCCTGNNVPNIDMMPTNKHQIIYSEFRALRRFKRCLAGTTTRMYRSCRALVTRSLLTSLYTEDH